MNNSINYESKIIFLKSRFFLTRILSYFSFFLIPIYVQKSLVLPFYFKALLMTLYSIFMLGQWFLLGKEIDYRLKIYFEVNSSVDRIVYRLLLGMTFMVLVYNILNLFPYKWANNFFWSFWVLCGFFYSWPTRGKIIEESVSSNFSDLKYLDSFERTLLLLIFIFFIFSFPAFPYIENLNGLDIFLKDSQRIGSFFGFFLKMNLIPFFRYFSLYKVGFFTHFYVVGMGLFLLIFYSLVRHFFSRRLALLGMFAIISSWSFSKILTSNLVSSYLSIYTAIWIWSGLWVIKSSTYKSGLFLGLIGFLATLIDVRLSLLACLHFFICYFFFLRDKTQWFRNKFIKYFSFGFLLSLFTFFSWYFILKPEDLVLNITPVSIFMKKLMVEFNQKAVFSLSFLGLSLMILKYLRIFDKKINSHLFIDMNKMSFVLVSLFILLVYGFFFSPGLISGFGIIWPMVFLCLIPIEFIFQLSSRFRSNRNIIYLMYILICLLDSHFEGRVKIFLKLFNNS